MGLVLRGRLEARDNQLVKLLHQRLGKNFKFARYTRNIKPKQLGLIPISDPVHYKEEQPYSQDPSN